MTVTAESQSVLDQLVKRAQRLYSLPGVAMQVLELTQQAKVDTKALKNCIENDPALTTKILRVVNSSLFGMCREITELNQALALLGTKPLKLLVLGFSLPDELFSDIEGEVLQQYWQHTVVKAVAAREVSELVWDLAGDEAFIAGLLQDIGMLALIQSLGETYITFLDSVFQGRGDLIALEASTLGFDHAILSARLLQHWQLPRTLVQAIGTAHNTERIAALPPAERALPQILHVAELITRFLVFREPAFLSQLLDIGRQYEELTETQLDALISSLEAKVPQLAEILSLKLPGDTNYAAVLAAAHRQLADVATDAVPDLLTDLDSGAALLKDAQDLGREMERLVGDPLSLAESAPQPKPPAPKPAAPKPAAKRPALSRGSRTKFVDETGLCGILTTSIAACRQARRAISLAFVALDQFEITVMQSGMVATQQSVEVLGRSISNLLGQNGQCVQINDDRFAAVLHGYEREAAVETIRDLLEGVRKWSLDSSSRGRGSISISVGLATLSMPPKNFPVRELMDAAERCLDGVRLSGGDGLKSREVY